MGKPGGAEWNGVGCEGILRGHDVPNPVANSVRWHLHLFKAGCHRDRHNTEGNGCKNVVKQPRLRGRRCRAYCQQTEIQVQGMALLLLVQDVCIPANSELVFGPKPGPQMGSVREKSGESALDQFLSFVIYLFNE